jgi:hypothetical protein
VGGGQGLLSHIFTLTTKNYPIQNVNSVKIEKPEAGGVAQVVEHLPCKDDALSSNFGTAK